MGGEAAKAFPESLQTWRSPSRKPGAARMDSARCVSAVLTIIAHAGTCDSRDNAAENQKPTNSLRPVETFNSAAQRDNEDTGPEQRCRPAPEYRVKLVKDGLPQRVNKAGEEKGSGQTNIEQLDRKPLLRSEHRFHHPLDQDSSPRNPLGRFVAIRVLLLFVLFSFRFVAATCYKHGKLPRINSLIIAFTRNIVLKTLPYSGCYAGSRTTQPLPVLEEFAVPSRRRFAAMFRSQSHQITAL